MTWRRGWRRRTGPPVDFFGTPIMVGDRYFYGAPPTPGLVVKVGKTTITLDVGAGYHGENRTMLARSPDKGVCLDRVPFDIFERLKDR